MKIVVQFLAQARAAAGCTEVELAMTAPVALADAISAAVEAVANPDSLRPMIFTDNGELQSWLLITIDGAAVANPKERQLQDWAHVQLMPPISGG